MKYPLSALTIVFKWRSSLSSLRICTDKTKLEVELIQMKLHRTHEFKIGPPASWPLAPVSLIQK